MGRESGRRFDDLVANALNGIYQCSEAGDFMSVNPALVRMLGYESEDEVYGRRLSELVASKQETAVITRGLKEESRLEGIEVTLKGRDGLAIPAILNARWAKGNGGGPYHEGILTDISHLKRNEKRLLHLATHDPLTGLHNRREFTEILDRHLAHIRRYGSSGALLWMDLDGFKGINDSLGHKAGDELLASVAHRMKATIRDSDVLARLGGDEFAVFYPNVDGREAHMAVMRLLEAIRTHTTAIQGKSVRTTASMGVVLLPEHGTLATELLLKADMAMYRAKEAGRNRVVVYSADQEQVERPESRVDWLRVIREALENDNFILYAQPIFDLKTNRTTRYEVLLRLRDHAGNIIPPGAFLDVAEQFGLSGDIDRWVLRRVMEILSDPSLGDEISFAVNLSPLSLTDPELLAMVTEEKAVALIGPVRLVLEITETAAIYNIHVAKDFLRTLRTQGYEFALDDFGMGFSSFYQLKNLDVDYLKIDGSFVRNLSSDPVDKHLVVAMVQLARSLGKCTIAEFVEDEETLEILRAIGVDCAQGFHIGRPRPLDNVLREIRLAAGSVG